MKPLERLEEAVEQVRVKQKRQLYLVRNEQGGVPLSIINVCGMIVSQGFYLDFYDTRYNYPADASDLFIRVYEGKHTEQVLAVLHLGIEDKIPALIAVEPSESHPGGKQRRSHGRIGPESGPVFARSGRMYSPR